MVYMWIYVVHALCCACDSWYVCMPYMLGSVPNIHKVYTCVGMVCGVIYVVEVGFLIHGTCVTYRYRYR